MTDNVECVVIGAGVVGLAVACKLARSGIETLVLERERTIGSATSSRNSEVIHAGIYYKPGSLKADLCVAGKMLLYEYCERHGVEFSNCGKLIVATSDDQLTKLESIIANARASGVSDLRMLSRQEVAALEPELVCTAAILSPTTGIVDSHGLMLALQGDLERNGGVVVFGSTVSGGQCLRDGILLNVVADREIQLRARYVVNCAGLHAQEFARHLDGLSPHHVPSLYYAKGNYYSLNCKSPFRRLVYPVPEMAGLGVHLTLDLGGRARFGPDVEWVDQISYDVDPDRCNGFYDEIRKYWPGIPAGALSPGYAGIRPKLHPPGGDAGDFEIQGADRHGVAGLVNLFGIESPGLTASLAIAELVNKCLR